MSRQPRTFAVLTFGSTHTVLDAEALLDDLGFEVVPIPAPSSLSAECGIALRLEAADVGRALTYLDRAGLEVVSQGSIDDV